MSTPVTTPALVSIDTQATTKAEVIRELAERLVAEGRVTDIDSYLADVAKREEVMATGIQGGIGIPHARSECVTAPSVAVATSKDGIPFGAPDGPAHLIFLIAAPTGADDSHLQILAAIARRVMRDEFRDALRTATDPAFIADTMTKEVQQ
ncbi:MAG: PTS sugar transporter subunit IIA [Microbacteriaceae bacterium]|jgi:fructose-specific phosphotransferase system IIA component